MAVCLICGSNPSTRRKPLTCHKDCNDGIRDPMWLNLPPIRCLGMRVQSLGNTLLNQKNKAAVIVLAVEVSQSVPYYTYLKTVLIVYTNTYYTYLKMVLIVYTSVYYTHLKRVLNVYTKVPSLGVHNTHWCRQSVPSLSMYNMYWCRQLQKCSTRTWYDV
jgi:hypothetical protein